MAASARRTRATQRREGRDSTRCRIGERADRTVLYRHIDDAPGQGTSGGRDPVPMRESQPSAAGAAPTPAQ